MTNNERTAFGFVIRRVDTGGYRVETRAKLPGTRLVPKMTHWVISKGGRTIDAALTLRRARALAKVYQTKEQARG